MMEKNKINDERINGNNGLEKTNKFVNINVTTDYCAKCGKPINSKDKYIRKDQNDNLFCDRECLKEFWNEVRREIGDRFYGWNRR